MNFRIVFTSAAGDSDKNARQEKEREIMAWWILGYTMFVLGGFWIGWDFVGPGTLLWGLSLTCLICSIAGGLLWWQDERSWRQDTGADESPALMPSPNRLPTSDPVQTL
jgi:hypothetical protein